LRTPSMYRLIGGLHNGYDIAYPPGTRIVAGWPGRVTSVANWYGAEYGVTVASADGFQTTYGHLEPSVRSGDWVEPGDVVGRVVRDHVDIKMRDAVGRYVDFGRSVPLGGATVAGSQPSTASGGSTAMSFRIRPPAKTPSKTSPLRGPGWTRDSQAVRAALAYLRLRREESLLLTKGAAAESEQALVQRRLADARARLLSQGVPEEVLLAAFLESPAAQRSLLPQADVERAHEALPQLKILMEALNA
jgi:hypothetical protein